MAQVYAAAFFAVPLVRWLQNKGRNADIEESNSSRRESAARLGAPRPQLASKLDSARQLGQASKKVITDRVRLLLCVSLYRSFLKHSIVRRGHSFSVSTIAGIARQHPGASVQCCCLWGCYICTRDGARLVPLFSQHHLKRAHTGVPEAFERLDR